MVRTVSDTSGRRRNVINYRALETYTARGWLVSTKRTRKPRLIRSKSLPPDNLRDEFRGDMAWNSRHFTERINGVNY